jgi:hypothetical protein
MRYPASEKLEIIRLVEGGAASGTALASVRLRSFRLLVNPPRQGNECAFQRSVENQQR